MKKIFYLMLTLAATFVTSCSNDAIDIDVEEEEVIEPEVVTSTYDLNVSIITSSAYDAYGIGNWETLLGNNSGYFYIGIWTYLYDESGYLVDYVKSYTETFTNLTSTFGELESGTYTIVCVETLVDSDYDYESLVCTMEDTDKLSTFVIKMNAYTNIIWCYTIATTTQTLTISDNNQSVTIEPEPIGEIITFSYENINNSDYAKVGLYLKNVPLGYYVSSDYTGSTKYYYNKYNNDTTYNCLCNFSDDKLTSSDSDSFYILASGSQNYTFGLSTSTQVENSKYTPYPSEEGVDITFENGINYIAYLLNTQEGDSIATFLGTSDDFNEWYNNIE